MSSTQPQHPGHHQQHQQQQQQVLQSESQSTDQNPLLFVDEEAMVPSQLPASTTVASTAETTATDKQALSFPMLWFALGAILGLTVQFITVGTHAYILLHRSKSTPSAQYLDPFLPSHIARHHDNGLRTIAMNITHNTDANLDVDVEAWRSNPLLLLGMHIDFLFYGTIWILFICTMTKCGRRLLPSCMRSVSKEALFSIGCNVLIGSVAGSFVAWLLMDRQFGLPLPMGSIICTVYIDCILCYLLATWGRESMEDEEQSEQHEQQQKQQQQQQRGLNHDSGKVDDGEGLHLTAACIV